MPTYRYRCGTCGDEFEVWQSITDDALTTHDTDGGPLVKVLSPAGIVLKGSGFYKNDSRSNGGRSGSHKDKESATSDSGSGDGSKSDSASDTKKSDTTTSDAKKSETKKADTKKSSTTAGKK